VAGLAREEVRVEAQRGCTQHEQFVGQCAHVPEVGHHGGAQRGHLAGKDIRLEPVAVDLRITGGPVGADGKGLLEIWWRLGALGVAVGLDTGW